MHLSRLNLIFTEEKKNNLNQDDVTGTLTPPVDLWRQWEQTYKTGT